MRLNNIIITSLLLASTACSDKTTGNSPETPPTNAGSVEKSISIDASQVYQTIDGFGASDCWIPAFVGRTWTSKRDGIAQLLFSSEIKDGKPLGIGLSMWRVNLGGGSYEQGDKSGITDKTRRAESYLNNDGTYDWNRCEGQRYFMGKAKELGCSNFILFSNTPPVQYTYNGKGLSNKGGISNLKADRYDDFSEYMAKVAQKYTTDGYSISHISPVNEPQYNWDSGQEGSAWTNEEVAKLSKSLDAKLTEKGLDTKILISEAGDWDYLFKTKSDDKRSNIIPSFFDTSSSMYIGNLKHLENIICAHSYWTDGTWDGMRDTRMKVKSMADKYNLKLWQSEWSMLGDGYSKSEFVGYDNATEMDIALYMSKVIHNDLTVANVSSWSFWTSMDISRWGHKNRFLLISLIPQGGVNGDIEQEGTFAATPTLWVLGNYSRFIRPGYKRISLNLSESRSFFGSAWISPDSKTIVAVISNLSNKNVRLLETHDNWNSTVKSITTYTTTGSKALYENKVDLTQQVIVEANSVTTIVYNL